MAAHQPPWTLAEKDILMNLVENAPKVGSTNKTKESLAFKCIDELVKELHNFEGSLKSVTTTINLEVPQAKAKPLTMPQVMFVLPFYYLGFAGWACLASSIPSLKEEG
jgi:hypothetical protein